jgi:elongator complex protein 3
MEGITRVQLGIQSTDDYVLELNKRGHTVESSIKAIMCLRDAGFKVDGHLMPDLPGTSLETDYEMMKTVFTGSDLQLDYTKIYPCLDLPYTEIREWKENGEWCPIAENNFPGFLTLLCDTMAMIPPWTRVNRVQRDFPEASEKNGGLGYVSDTIKTNLQQIVSIEMGKRNMKCYDIRSREIGTELVDSLVDKVKLYIRTYRANEGTEFFISAEAPKESPCHFDDTYLLGLCRLRIPDYEFTDKEKHPCPVHYIPAFRRPNHRVSRIRELHTYGSISSSVTNSSGNTQHKGVGKFLVSVAENISAMYGCTRVSVISGVGVRDYYSHLGYSLQNHYMVKDLNVVPSMCLFGKVYSPAILVSVILTSMVSRTYIVPIWRDKPTVIPALTSKEHLQVDRHIYANIQHGDAEGFSIAGEVPVMLFDDPRLTFLVGFLMYLVLTYVLLLVLS